ncbi:MAG TPA: hypothetical protein VMF58_05320 [Rhizomicrobium sp.]|nr:hypothetical protein [Rhizomicrobium sp.]
MPRKFRPDEFGIGIAAIAVVAAQFFASPAAAAPPLAQGRFISGSGSIRPVPGGVVIDQTSARAVIDWRGFPDVLGTFVRLNNHDGVTFIRERGDSLLRIAGSLRATGSVYLISRRGINIMPSGTIVTTGNFIASTGDSTSANSTSRGLQRFSEAGGSVMNDGSIVSVRGNVALIGSAVENSGSISAEKGSALLAASNEGSVLARGGHGAAISSGGISARRVAIESADGDVSIQRRPTSLIRAVGTAAGDGRVLLLSHGATRIAGAIAARDADRTGGTIIATGNTVYVASSARLDASGRRGGTVLLGGRARRGAFAADDRIARHVLPAIRTIVERGAVISADGENGKGGEVVVWSKNATRFAGAISARGSSGAMAGFAEVSSRGRLTLTGHVDLTATHGGAGTLLLDPYNVTISKGKDVTENCSGGVCAPEGNNSVLGVRTLKSLLATSNVEVTSGTSGSQSGDITVAAPISWSSAYTLTLDAYHSVLIDAPISVKGAGGLSVVTNDGGSGGTLAFAADGHVRFSNLGSVLTINGASFALVSSIATLARDIKANPTGNFALARSYDASRDGTYASSPIPTTLAGFVEGLGNAIVNLSISDGTTSDLVGLFSANIGTIENLNLENATIIGPQGTANASSIVGGLSGTNFGYLSNDVISGSVSIGSGGGFANVGGLAGASSGAISGSNSTAVVTAGVSSNAGGIVGLDNTYGSITNSFASGNVTGGDSGESGGLAGDNVGTISYSYATGTVAGGANAGVGGLSGDNVQTGSIVSDYASGSTTGGANTAAGGLVGFNYASIYGSWAEGAVNGGVSSNLGGLVGATDGSVTDSFATGNVVGTGDYIQAGGLAGSNFGSGTVADSWSDGGVTAGDFASAGGFAGNNVGSSISNSYALGNATGGQNADVGGLIGYSNSATSYAYSAGAPIGGSNAYVGGLIGYADVNSGVTDGYWDTTTSGITDLSQGAGNISNDAGITGLTTAELQSGLPAGFNSAIWAESASINDGLPYLLANPPGSLPASIIRRVSDWRNVRSSATSEASRNCIDGRAPDFAFFWRCSAANAHSARGRQRQ